MFLCPVLAISTVMINNLDLGLEFEKGKKITLLLCLSCFPHRNTLRVTRSAALSSQDGSVGAGVHLGKKGKDFDFSQVPMKVEFVECSARGSKGEEGDADMDSLEKILAKLWNCVKLWSQIYLIGTDLGSDQLPPAPQSSGGGDCSDLSEVPVGNINPPCYVKTVWR